MSDLSQLGPLSDAIKKLAKKRRKPKQKKRRGYCIFAFGARHMKGLNKRSIEAAILKIVRNIPEGESLSYVVLGNVRETEKTIYALCRKHHLSVALVPSDFEKFSINAEGLRNGLALQFFKPATILLAHPDPDEASENKPIMRWAKNHGATVVKVGPKPEKEKSNGKGSIARSSA